MPSRPKEAHQRAIELDQRLAATIADVSLPPPQTLFREIRHYLQHFVDSQQSYRDNNPQELIRFVPPAGGVALIQMGPQIDKGPAPKHFNFASGARLSFGITVREEATGWRLLAYRFHLQLPERRPWEFYRFELRTAQHPQPLREPRCHLHPGLANLRLPCPVFAPLEILDHIFFVIEPTFAH